jgi:hypothetical protein
MRLVRAPEAPQTHVKPASTQVDRLRGNQAGMSGMLKAGLTHDTLRALEQTEHQSSFLLVPEDSDAASRASAARSLGESLPQASRLAGRGWSGWAAGVRRSRLPARMMP